MLDSVCLVSCDLSDSVTGTVRLDSVCGVSLTAGDELSDFITGNMLLHIVELFV